MNRRSAGLSVLALCVLASAPAATAQAPWVPKPPRLSTPWTSLVSPTNALPEYPRPQMVRSAWQSLNGVWQFADAADGEAPPFGRTLAESILVPFPVESAISGIMRTPDRMWYRRTFTVPAGWAGQRVLLQFGAVDWETTVYVNGASVGTHRGGYDSFAFDITPRLNGGVNELVVGVHDPSDVGQQPIGKQRNAPGGIWYTTVSGIWQTVWLEPVPAARITRLDMQPDLASNRLRLTVRGAGISGQTVEVVALDGTAPIGSATGGVGAEILVPVPNPRLWSPDDPFLYNLRVSLKSGSTTVDQVGSYFGMRSIGLATLGGVLRPVLNGRFVFQIGTLDQGYWPDGLYTAPTDAALRFDLEKHKELGYNMVRKHIKVEPARWFYWADRLGLLVWQDMPSLRAGLDPSPAARTQFEAEMREMVDEHRSFTSIVVWVTLNEGWGQYDQARLASLVESWDPSRLVDNQSGVNCCGALDGGNGDVVDWHVYVGPGSPTPSTTRAAVLGEFGGLGLRVDGHMWDSGAAFAYEMQANAAALNTRYVGLIQQVRRLMDDPGLSAAIYTEITDLENEINGMLTYDRRIMKADVAAVHDAHLGLINASRQITGRLAAGRHVSLEVSTPGFTGRYMRHSNSLGFTEAVSGASDAALKQDATFKVVAGLADASCYSFESRNFPGHFWRHSSSRLRKDPRDGSALFDQQATFCARAALDGSGGISLESRGNPGSFIRHRSAELWLDPLEDSTLYRQDASWRVAPAWWRSAADIPVNTFQSLRVTTPGFTSRYLRHTDNLGFTEVVDAGSSATLKQDATFRVVPGLADSSCYSFESRNFPGHYLRHAGFRIRKDPRDGSALFDQDATFCAQPGLSGSGVTLQSYNFPDRAIRHINAEAWIANSSGANAWDNPASYAQDATWTLAAPWAP